MRLAAPSCAYGTGTYFGGRRAGCASRAPELAGPAWPRAAGSLPQPPAAALP